MGLFKKNRNKNRKVYLYVVSEHYEEQNGRMPIGTKIYTYTSTLEEAMEYIDGWMRVQNDRHFDMWCGLRDKQRDENSWREYVSTVLRDREYNIVVTKLTFVTSSIASLFRMYYHCIPIGCSYEKQCERDKFEESLDEDTKKDIEDIIKEEQDVGE